MNTQWSMRLYGLCGVLIALAGGLSHDVLHAAQAAGNRGHAQALNAFRAALRSYRSSSNPDNAQKLSEAYQYIASINSALAHDVRERELKPAGLTPESIRQAARGARAGGMGAAAPGRGAMKPVGQYDADIERRLQKVSLAAAIHEYSDVVRDALASVTSMQANAPAKVRAAQGAVDAAQQAVDAAELVPGFAQDMQKLLNGLGKAKQLASDAQNAAAQGNSQQAAASAAAATAQSAAVVAGAAAAAAPTPASQQAANQAASAASSAASAAASGNPAAAQSAAAKTERSLQDAIDAALAASPLKSMVADLQKLTFMSSKDFEELNALLRALDSAFMSGESIVSQAEALELSGALKKAVEKWKSVAESSGGDAAEKKNNREVLASIAKAEEAYKKGLPPKEITKAKAPTATEPKAPSLLELMHEGEVGGPISAARLEAAAGNMKSASSVRDAVNKLYETFGVAVDDAAALKQAIKNIEEPAGRAARVKLFNAFVTYVKSSFESAHATVRNKANEALVAIGMPAIGVAGGGGASPILNVERMKAAQTCLQAYNRLFEGFGVDAGNYGDLTNEVFYGSAHDPAKKKAFLDAFVDKTEACFAAANPSVQDKVNVARRTLKRGELKATGGAGAKKPLPAGVSESALRGAKNAGELLDIIGKFGNVSILELTQQYGSGVIDDLGEAFDDRTLELFDAASATEKALINQKRKQYFGLGDVTSAGAGTAPKAESTKEPEKPVSSAPAAGTLQAKLAESVASIRSVGAKAQADGVVRQEIASLEPLIKGKPDNEIDTAKDALKSALNDLVKKSVLTEIEAAELASDVNMIGE